MGMLLLYNGFVNFIVIGVFQINPSENASVNVRDPRVFIYTWTNMNNYVQATEKELNTTLLLLFNAFLNESYDKTEITQFFYASAALKKLII